MTRRTFSALVVSAGGVLVTGIVGIPAMVTALSPALSARRRPDWRRLGPLDRFPVGQVRKELVKVEAKSWPRPLPERAVFVWRPSPDEFVVFSRSCTDLSCPLTYDSGSECFLCPCHGGIFSKDGSVMAGPPSRPMDRYQTRLRGGEVEIDLASLPVGI